MLHHRVRRPACLRPKLHGSLLTLATPLLSCLLRAVFSLPLDGAWQSMQVRPVLQRELRRELGTLQDIQDGTTSAAGIAYMVHGTEVAAALVKAAFGGCWGLAQVPLTGLSY